MININKRCNDCGGTLSIKRGSNGLFLGCSGYPDCRHTESIDLLNETIKKLKDETVIRYGGDNEIVKPSNDEIVAKVNELVDHVSRLSEIFSTELFMNYYRWK